MGRPLSENPSPVALRVRASRARRGVAKAEAVVDSVPVSDNRPKETFQEASLRKEIAIADQREMENAVRRGELVEASAVAAEWSELCTSVKNAILAIPDRVSLRCERKSAREIREIMMSELRAALHTIADSLEDAA